LPPPDPKSKSPSSTLPPAGALDTLTGVVEALGVVAALLTAVAPTSTTQTLPVLPALLHAAASSTNSLYSAANTLVLVIAKKQKLTRNSPTCAALFFALENILNLPVTVKLTCHLVWHGNKASSLERRFKGRNLSTDFK
jgi:fucose permease